MNEPATQTGPQLPAKLERIVLTGFMGSGKSTVGAMLAERLGWTFLDLDSEIEARCGMSVPEIFTQKGEAHFRQQEAAALAAVLGRSPVVIALGGGAPETHENRMLLQQAPATTVFFLDAPFHVLHGRCLDQQASESATAARPLLADPEAAEARFHTRRGHYAGVATHQVDTSALSPQEVLQSMLALLSHG